MSERVYEQTNGVFDITSAPDAANAANRGGGGRAAEFQPLAEPHPVRGGGGRDASPARGRAANRGGGRAASPARDLGICQNILDSGICPFGNLCRYRHP